MDAEKTTGVYLPDGTVWYDLWTGNSYEGGQTVEMPAPIDKIPLFLKAGAIVPFGPVIQYADEILPEEMMIFICPGENGTFTLYEDDGNTYEYEEGHYATIEFSWDDAEKILTINNRQGEYPGMLKTRKFTIALVQEDMGSLLEVEEGKVVEYTGEEITVSL